MDPRPDRTTSEICPISVVSLVDTIGENILFSVTTTDQELER